jgi:hypothetical protein
MEAEHPVEALTADRSSLAGEVPRQAANNNNQYTTSPNS